jgi:hypothetical protein
MNAQYISNKLFAEPSFLEGVSSVLDIHGELHKTYNTSKTANEADKKALQNDWRAVGDDLKVSISKYEQELARSAK